LCLNSDKAWRVTHATTLFDYAPGTSTVTFTITLWPQENPQSCIVPRPIPGGPWKAAAQISTPRSGTTVLQRNPCAGAARQCQQDVMITGEPGFARLSAH
jgi:hypothetical protein